MLVRLLPFLYLRRMKAGRWGVVSWWVLLAMSGFAHAEPLDPLDLAEGMPGATWKQVMKEFHRLDSDRDGVLSRAERQIEGEIHRKYQARNLYYISDEAQVTLPLRWTAGVNFVWDDGTVTRAEFWRMLMISRSLRPAQRAAAAREWLQFRREAREAP